MRKLLAIALLVLPLGAFAEFPEKLPAPGEHAVTFISTWDETTQPALLFVPTAADVGVQLPLLVALHGKGVDHNAWFRFTPVMEKAENHGYVVVTPHGRGDLWYRGPGEQDVLDLIDHLLATGRIDPDRVYLAGHSMGGWGTWWIGLRNAERFASIAPMAGFSPMDLLPNALHLDPYIIHDRDDDVVPVDLSRRPAARLSELGISHRYVETTGYRHDSRLIGDSLDDVFEWFSARRRISDPKRILLAARTPAKASHGRLHILATETVSEPAGVELEWTGVEQTSLRVGTQNVTALAIGPGFHSLLPLEIDGQLIEEPSFDAVHAALTADPSLQVPEQFHLTKKDGVWTAHLVMALPPPAISTKSVSSELEGQLANASQEQVARTLGALVAKAAGADGMIVRADAFAWLGSPLTPDRLADSYVSGAETLGHFELSGRQIKDALRADDKLVLAGIEVSALDDEATYAVVSPMSPLVRVEVLKVPLKTTTPIYPLLFEGLGITPWE
jgi:pimeloyl-ACP methyl ester carboxylesterase